MSWNNAGEVNMKRDLVRLFRKEKKLLLDTYKKDLACLSSRKNVIYLSESDTEGGDIGAQIAKINLLSWVINKVLEA
jgi:hypothetical protein